MRIFKLSSWSVNYLLSIITLSTFALGETSWVGKREPANFKLVPQELNKTAILKCLDKLKGFVSDQETASIDNLKTKIERIYGLKRPMIQYRELFYKDQSNTKWKIEFYLTPDSLWGKEKYKLKYFKADDNGAFHEAQEHNKDDLLNKEALLKFDQFEQVEGDERWEKFIIPGDPLVSYKQKDFKLFELKVIRKNPKSLLLCNIAGGHPLCQCNL